jgi:hypothetical protein
MRNILGLYRVGRFFGMGLAEVAGRIGFGFGFGNGVRNDRVFSRFGDGGSVLGSHAGFVENGARGTTAATTTTAAAATGGPPGWAAR